MELSDDECKVLLEAIRWHGTPECPYCGSTNSTSVKKENRHHCNSCFCSYSVTVGTLFHGSRVPLSKWFKAIHLYLDLSLEIKNLSVRSLASKIDVNKNTASLMLQRIRSSLEREPDLLSLILAIKMDGHNENK